MCKLINVLGQDIIFFSYCMYLMTRFILFKITCTYSSLREITLFKPLPFFSTRRQWSLLLECTTNQSHFSYTGLQMLPMNPCMPPNHFWGPATEGCEENLFLLNSARFNCHFFITHQYDSDAYQLLSKQQFFFLHLAFLQSFILQTAEVETA